MFGRRGWRLLIVIAVLGVGLVWVWKTKLDPNRASLFVTAVIGAVTTIYVLVTYEIMLQNQSMAKATSDSSIFMERSLRFQHSPNLTYRTVNTKDPTFGSKGNSIAPIDNDDYKLAREEFAAGAGGQQKEFVFAVVQNNGQGAATNLDINTAYRIVDSSSLNRDAEVRKQALVQILEPHKAVALCVFISRVPTANDRVSLVSAQITAGDFYRDAIGESAQQIAVDVQQHRHHVEADPGCVVQLR